MDEPFVVFVVGMRFNRLRAVHRWLPVVRAARRMRVEQGDPEGLLGSRLQVGWRTLTFVQYWESIAALSGYAHDGTKAHRAAWRDFERAIAETDAVGIFHETFRVEPDAYETVYRNMPAHGLGSVGERVPATGEYETMVGRLGARVDQSNPSGGEQPGESTQRSR